MIFTLAVENTNTGIWLQGLAASLRPQNSFHQEHGHVLGLILWLSLQEICSAASWVCSNTFVKCYLLDVTSTPGACSALGVHWVIMTQDVSGTIPMRGPSFSA